MLYAIIRQRKIEIKQPTYIVRNGVNVDTLHLEMDDEWARMDRIIAVFTLTYTKYEPAPPPEKAAEAPQQETPAEPPIPVLHTVQKMMLVEFGAPVTVPWEVLVETGTLTLSVTGYVDTLQVMRTAAAQSGWDIIMEGGDNEGVPILPTPTPTLLQQLLDAAKGADDAATAANEAAAVALQAALDIKAQAENGEFDGKPGEPGSPGPKGKDGFSPVVTTKDVPDGVEVTITDADGTRSFVLEDGRPGTDVASVLTVIVTEFRGKLSASKTFAEIKEAVDQGKEVVAYHTVSDYNYYRYRKYDFAEFSFVSGSASGTKRYLTFREIDTVISIRVGKLVIADDESVTIHNTFTDILDIPEATDKMTQPIGKRGTELFTTPSDKLVTIDVEYRPSDGTFWTMPIDPEDPPDKRPTAKDIIDMVNANKEVRLHFFDTVTDTGDQLYAYETTLAGVPYFRRNVIKPDQINRINIGVQYNGEVKFTDISYTPPTRAIYAICEDAAAPQSLSPNTWYVSKNMPRPSGEVGMFADVYWENGRVDDLGYDVRLVWGAPGDPDNELILDQTNTSNHLTGEHSIPVQGTVRYQLVESGGHKSWRYVSGKLLPRQFSSATAAATADKVVPGMQLSYIPGEEIFVQLDQGNTAEVARIVPDEGPTLSVYGNGEGAKTGEIPAGYILHLANAGDHWQILNSPGKGGGSQTAVLYTPMEPELTIEEKEQARKNIEAAGYTIIRRWQ